MLGRKKELAQILAKVPYSKRVVLLPQCLCSNNCQAKKKQFGVLDCILCGKLRGDGIPCPVATMKRLAAEIGYADLLIFTGGSGIVPYFKKNGKPLAVLAVACPMEIEEGLEKMDKFGVTAQVVDLVHDGCAETSFTRDPKTMEDKWREELTKYPPVS